MLVCFSAVVTNAAEQDRGIPPPPLEYELSNRVGDPLPAAATRCYQSAHNKDTELGACDQALGEVSPFDVRGLSAIYTNRALISSYSGDFEAALNDMDRALEVLPDEPALLINHGNILSRMHRYEEAMASYQGAIYHSNGTSAIAYYNRVFVHRMRGDINLAVQDLEAARRLVNPIKEDLLLQNIRDELRDGSVQPQNSNQVKNL